MARKMKDFKMKEKRLLLLLLSCLLVGCVSKRKQVERTKQREQVDVKINVDSLVKKVVKEYQDSVQFSFELSKVAEVKTLAPDSTGYVPPLNYVRYVQGKEVERIQIEGGQLNRSERSQSRKATTKVKKSSIAKEHKQIVAKKDTIVQRISIEKTKDKEVKNIAGGVYVIVGIVLIVLILLWWIDRKLKKARL